MPKGRKNSGHRESYAVPRRLVSGTWLDQTSPCRGRRATSDVSIAPRGNSAVREVRPQSYRTLRRVAQEQGHTREHKAISLCTVQYCFYF